MKYKADQKCSYLPNKRNLLFLLFVLPVLNLYAQKEFSPDLSKAGENNLWTVSNREIIINKKDVYLTDKANAGMLYLQDFFLENGKVEFDVKGRDMLQKSFVGLAFHIENDSTYDAVYFRPFNFKTPGKEGRSVQYISIPGYDWPELREKSPGKYENKVQPIPEPSSWFHVTVELKYPSVKVFVNYSAKPSLVVEQLNARTTGKIGFWVGNGSDGYFRNLKIVPAQNKHKL